MHPPSDWDIALPRGRLSIAGTTSIPRDRPDDRRVGEEEVALVWERIFELLPGLRAGTTRHAWSAVRPLFQPEGDRDAAPRDVHAWSREFTVTDHQARNRCPGLLTVVGGKLTTFRLMAEKTSNAEASQANWPGRSSSLGKSPGAARSPDVMRTRPSLQCSIRNLGGRGASGSGSYHGRFRP